MRDRTITEQVFDQRTQAKRAPQPHRSRPTRRRVRQAELDLEFTELRAPVAGRIGDRRVSPGNLVTGGPAGNTTLLATIVSTRPDPLRVHLRRGVVSALRALLAQRQGGRPAATAASSSALKLIDEKDFAHRGTMDFVDNVIDAVVRHDPRPRACSHNPDGVLTPGMFGRIRVPGSPPYQALLVPDAAIGTEQVAQVRAGGRRRQHGGGRNTSRSAS